MNVTAQTDKSCTLQHMERVFNSVRRGRPVGSADSYYTSAEPTETFVFHSVRPYRVGGSARLAPSAHFKAEVRQARKRRRYIRGSRKTRSAIRRAARIYNEHRKAGLTTAESIAVVHAYTTGGGTNQRVDPTRRHIEASAATGAGWPALPVPRRSYRSTWFAAVASAIARVTSSGAGTEESDVRRSYLPSADSAGTPHLFTHNGAVGGSTEGTASLSIGDFGAAHLRGSTHTTAVRTSRRDTGGRVRLHVMEAETVAEQASPEERTRPQQRLEDKVNASSLV